MNTWLAHFRRCFKLLGAFCLCILLSNSHAYGSEKVLIIIANKDLDLVTINHVKNYYFLKHKLLPNQERALLCALGMNEHATITFSQSVFGYYPYQLQRLWDQSAFSGRAKRPIKFENSATLMAFILHNKHALGYAMVEKTKLGDVRENYHVIQIIE